KLPFEDETFDIVYAANLLHHVDLEKTCSEVRRVLKCCGGGGAGNFVCIEPLAYNPIINIFRLLTPKIRTRDEHPLKMKDISLISKSFKSFTFQTTWFFANALFLKMFFIERINPNKERYWVRIITHHKKYEKAFCFLHKLDTFFLKIFPFMRKFCRYITMVCVK
ncbi:MAG: class I SAM-dependent methyltransferase, partial [Spirochaetaceae bacterium]|nr:class I SAM-dependent methyltransferase [Spirochaetaceae bacterium]